MMKDIDADYYGYMDDDDGILVPLELKAEKLCMILLFTFKLFKNGVNIELKATVITRVVR